MFDACFSRGRSFRAVPFSFDPQFSAVAIACHDLVRRRTPLPGVMRGPAIVRVLSPGEGTALMRDNCPGIARGPAIVRLLSPGKGTALMRDHGPG